MLGRINDSSAGSSAGHLGAAARGRAVFPAWGSTPDRTDYTWMCNPYAVARKAVGKLLLNSAASLAQNLCGIPWE